MWRIIFPGPDRVLFEEFDAPPLCRAKVLVRSVCSLVSNGTERTAFRNRFASGTHWDQWVHYPFSPGYATVGTVVETSSDVSLVRVGQRVAIRAPHASHHVVAESACIPIPDQVSFEDAVWFALAKIGFLGACVAEVKPGATVLVIGGGPIAQMLVRWLTISGAGIVGLLARDPVQLENGKSGGATVPIRAQTNEISLDKIEGALGKQPQTIFDCTDSVDVLSWALRVVADYGRVVLLGDPGTPNQRRLTSDVLLRSITVVGVHDRNVFGQWNEKTISQLFFKSLSTRHFSLSGLCTHVFKPVDAPRAYALIGNGATGVLGIRFDWTTLPELNLVN